LLIFSPPQIGFEIWTMQKDILFDNIYIGHSVEDAEALAEESFLEKHPHEELAELADKPQPEEAPKSPSDLQFLDDPVTYIKEKVDLFVTLAKRDPVMAIKAVPEVAGGAAAILLTLLAVVGATLTVGGAQAAPAVKKAAADASDKAKDVKDKVVDAATSGAETVKAEVNKRTTRSTQ
jgi:calnexin